MAKNEPNQSEAGREGVISIIGPGMQVTGDCETEGTLRIEGNVKGTVKAGKAVVVGKDGVVDGDINTQDAVVGGRVTGSIVAESRLELQATCVVEGEIEARRIKLEEGGRVNGTVQIGEVSGRRTGSAAAGSPGSGSHGSQGSQSSQGSQGSQESPGSRSSQGSSGSQGSSDASRADSSGES